MADAIQKSSTVPLSRAQTRENPADPRDVSSPRSFDDAAARRAEQSKIAEADEAAADFAKSTISIVEKAIRKPHADAADLVSQNSVYLSPDQSRPL